MIPYIIMLTIPILLHPFTKHTMVNHVKIDRLPLTLFFLILTVLVALRHPRVGNDTINYIHYFDQIARSGWNQIQWHNLEPGYQLFNKLLSLISGNSRFFLAAVALAVSVMLFLPYHRLCEDAPLSIVLFCNLSTFMMMFSGIRQMMAIGVGMIAYAFVLRKRPILFLLSVLVAMGFHTSAFMLLPMYPLYYTRITKKGAFFSLPVLVLAFVFNRQIFSVLGRLLQSYTKYEATQMVTGAYSMLALFALFAVFCFVIPDESILDEETIGLRNFLLFSLLIQMFAPLNMLAMRMNYYYIIFIPLLLPRIISCTRVRYRGVAVLARTIMLVFFFAYFFVRANSAITMHTVPYHFFWEHYS